MISSNEIKQNLGKNLKKLRLAKGLSQEQLAETVGLERETISSIDDYFYSPKFICEN